MSTDRSISCIRPSDIVLADLFAGDAERVPHSLGRVDDVGAARRLVAVLLVAAVQGVALVDDLGEHGPAVGVDPDVLVAAPVVRVPPRRQRHHELRVAVVHTVALRRI
uniref:Uncharacterized protein n=1 Tax=Oryza brachyantha TaxID=4533 RepID=J3LF50_ORYBR